MWCVEYLNDPNPFEVFIMEGESFNWHRGKMIISWFFLHECELLLVLLALKMEKNTSTRPMATSHVPETNVF